MLTVTNLNAGLDALGLDKLKSGDGRKKEARSLYRNLVSNKGVKPATAITKALEVAMKGITSNRSDRLKAAKHAAGVTMTSAVRQAAATATSNLPKRKQTQTQAKKAPKSKPSHWSHSGWKLVFFLALFWLLALAIILLVGPPLYEAYNTKYGVGAGTGAVTGLAVGLFVVTFLVNAGFRSMFNKHHPRPAPRLSSDKELKDAGLTK